MWIGLSNVYRPIKQIIGPIGDDGWYYVDDILQHAQA